MLTISCKKDAWVEQAVDALRSEGCAVVTGVLDDEFAGYVDQFTRRG